jgi:plasmid stabilization system protein ParE
VKRRRVIVDPVARADLKALHRWIARQGFPKTATSYIRRIQAFAKALDLAAERGEQHPEIGDGIRTIAFESVVVAVRTEDSRVVVLRVFHSSQDWKRDMGIIRRDDPSGI